MPRVNGYEQNFGFLVADVSRLLRKLFDNKMGALGLSRAQWRLIVNLRRQQGLSQSELAELLEIEKPTLVGLIDRMEETGWVERRADPVDRRVKRIFLVPGAARLDELEEAAKGSLDEALGGIDPVELARCEALIQQIKSNLHGVLNKPCADKTNRGK
ncbi:MAG: MarR family transcriptional regulator [Gammaproteobacteria bacterium]|nr:MarR family transcriptional regulator [Gammaproteobacteria bacterium]